MKKLTTILTLGLSIMFIIPAFAWASTHARITGTIQGASYVINHTVQPLNNTDPNAILERDFVLQCDDGSYYFLPNLDRTLKTQLINQQVVIAGDITGTQIIVHKVYKDKADHNHLFYDWDKDMAERYMMR
jgi:hypothetical protein